MPRARAQAEGYARTLPAAEGRPPFLVDTNVLLDVLKGDPQWAEWSITALRAQAKVHRLVINPVIYAELSVSFATLEALDAVVARLQLDVVPLTRPALFVAGKAFLQYRRRGGTKTQVLPDFFIGAQAAVNAWPLLKRDAARFGNYFPTVELLTP